MSRTIFLLLDAQGRISLNWLEATVDDQFVSMIVNTFKNAKLIRTLALILQVQMTCISIHSNSKIYHQFMSSNFGLFSVGFVDQKKGRESRFYYYYNTFGSDVDGAVDRLQSALGILHTVL